MVMSFVINCMEKFCKLNVMFQCMCKGIESSCGRPSTGGSFLQSINAVQVECNEDSGPSHGKQQQ